MKFIEIFPDFTEFKTAMSRYGFHFEDPDTIREQFYFFLLDKFGEKNFKYDMNASKAETFAVWNNFNTKWISILNEVSKDIEALVETHNEELNSTTSGDEQILAPDLKKFFSFGSNNKMTAPLLTGIMGIKNVPSVYNSLINEMNNLFINIGITPEVYDNGSMVCPEYKTNNIQATDIDAEKASNQFEINKLIWQTMIVKLDIETFNVSQASQDRLITYNRTMSLTNNQSIALNLQRIHKLLKYDNEVSAVLIGSTTLSLLSRDGVEHLRIDNNGATTNQIPILNNAIINKKYVDDATLFKDGTTKTKNVDIRMGSNFTKLISGFGRKIVKCIDDGNNSSIRLYHPNGDPSILMKDLMIQFLFPTWDSITKGIMINEGGMYIGGVSLSLTTPPTIDNDVTNKKYVDAEITKLRTEITTLKRKFNNGK